MRAEAGVEARDAVEHVVLAMMVCMHAAMLAAASGLLSDVRRGIALAFTVFCLFGGNAMGRLRPNRFVGVRSRSTLSSARVWRRTHRLAGRLLVAAGVLCAAVALFWPTNAGYAAAFGVFMAASLAPLPYAWWLARTAPPSPSPRGDGDGDGDGDEGA